MLDTRPSRESPAQSSAARHVQAWLLLAAVLAIHVVDEALTGFLDFYNPLVSRIRQQIPWFPMPTFTSGGGSPASRPWCWRWSCSHPPSGGEAVASTSRRGC
jgi:hypothetical protein